MAQLDAYQSLQTHLLSVADPFRARGLRHPRYREGILRMGAAADAQDFATAMEAPAFVLVAGPPIV